MKAQLNSQSQLTQKSSRGEGRDLIGKRQCEVMRSEGSLRGKEKCVRNRSVETAMTMLYQRKVGSCKRVGVKERVDITGRKKAIARAPIKRDKNRYLATKTSHRSIQGGFYV